MIGLTGNVTDVDERNRSGADRFLKVAGFHYSDMFKFSGNGLKKIP